MGEAEARGNTCRPPAIQAQGAGSGSGFAEGSRWRLGGSFRKYLLGQRQVLQRLGCETSAPAISRPRCEGAAGSTGFRRQGFGRVLRHLRQVLGKACRGGSALPNFGGREEVRDRARPQTWRPWKRWALGHADAGLRARRVRDAAGCDDDGYGSDGWHGRHGRYAQLRPPHRRPETNVDGRRIRRGRRGRRGGDLGRCRGGPRPLVLETGRPSRRRRWGRCGRAK
mmetsp:Transcript_4607/g.11438  ORF Transcript_4607/g.11438 Transcript_4607/m.11438 type:complete len:225 (-) Transcript_4607:112-786(-)